MAIYNRLIKMPDGTKQRSEIYWFKFSMERSKYPQEYRPEESKSSAAD
jgi:hypothetical protein